MLIESNQKNLKINVHNHEVSFNENGVAEVNKELGNKMIENFPKKFWEKGKKPESKPVTENKTDGADVAALKAEIERLQGIIVSKNEEVKKAQDSEKVWREEFEKLQKSLAGGNENLEGEDEEPEIGIPEGQKELYDEMMEKDVPTLKSFVKANFNKKDKDLKEFETKEQLIKLVFDLMQS